MSLTIAQKTATREEFARNFELLGILPAVAARDLGVGEARIKDIMNLRHVRRLEDAWVLRRYLLERARQANVTLVPFTALAGEPSDYWFLDASRIDTMLIDD